MIAAMSGGECQERLGGPQGVGKRIVRRITRQTDAPAQCAEAQVQSAEALVAALQRGTGQLLGIDHGYEQILAIEPAAGNAGEL